MQNWRAKARRYHRPKTSGPPGRDEHPTSAAATSCTGWVKSLRIELPCQKNRLWSMPPTRTLPPGYCQRIVPPSSGYIDEECRASACSGLSCIVSAKAIYPPARFESAPSPCTVCGARVVLTRIEPCRPECIMRTFECTRCTNVDHYNAEAPGSGPWVLIA